MDEVVEEGALVLEGAVHADVDEVLVQQLEALEEQAVDAAV